MHYVLEATDDGAYDRLVVAERSRRGEQRHRATSHCLVENSLGIVHRECDIAHAVPVHGDEVSNFACLAVRRGYDDMRVALRKHD